MAVANCEVRSVYCMQANCDWDQREGTCWVFVGFSELAEWGVIGLILGWALCTSRVLAKLHDTQISNDLRFAL